MGSSHDCNFPSFSCLALGKWLNRKGSDSNLGHHRPQLQAVIWPQRMSEALGEVGLWDASR